MNMNQFKASKKFGRIASVVVIITTITLVTVSVWKVTTTFKAAHSLQKLAKKSTSKGRIASVNHTRSNAQPYIHPPINGVDVPYKKYSVDASKGGTIVYKRSKIIIPAATFCDAKGNDITGKVDIKYREFHTPIDFFVSG